MPVDIDKMWIESKELASFTTKPKRNIEHIGRSVQVPTGLGTDLDRQFKLDVNRGLLGELDDVGQADNLETGTRPVHEAFRLLGSIFSFRGINLKL